MSNQSQALQFIQDEFLKRKKVNSLYSMRAYAKFLEVSPGALSEILQGKRKLSHKMALKFSERLNLSKSETKNFLLQVEGKKVDSKKMKEVQLDDDLFSIVSNWYCFAILNLADTKDFKWSVTWISKRLGISLIEVKDAIERMLRVGLIVENKGKYKASEDYILSPDGISSKAVKEYHRQILELATKALFEQSVDDRDISGISLALDPKDLKNMKKDILEFQNELVEKYSKGKKSEVYCLETALFKLTK